MPRLFKEYVENDQGGAVVGQFPGQLRMKHPVPLPPSLVEFIVGGIVHEDEDHLIGNMPRRAKSEEAVIAGRRPSVENRDPPKDESYQGHGGGGEDSRPAAAVRGA